MIFADTSFWVALNLARDTRRDDATRLLREHANAGWTTTTLVRGETWTMLRRKSSHASAARFLAFLERSPRVTVLHVDEEIDAEAIDWLRRHDERPYSHVDATSFAVMRSLGIARALAFDGDFSAAGFVELRPTRA